MKKVTIELTEAQAKIVLTALEEWFRLRKGQPFDLANGLAFLGYKHDPEHPERFDRLIQKRDHLYEVIQAMFHIAFGQYGTPQKLDPEVNIASDIWSTLRYAMASEELRHSTPFQMGSEPLPKITVEEEQ